MDKTDPEKSIETGEVHRANIHGGKDVFTICHET
ncbi:unnamed protein product [Arabidopsis halleri]